MRVGLLVATVLAAIASPLHAQDASPSRSVGAPNRGRLERGVRLRVAPALMLQRGSDQWGTVELVGLIERAAARLQEREPGPRLMVGDLSKRGGGRLRPHSSHQNGRDADLGLFLTDENGRAVEAPRFLELDRHACARDNGVAYCLDARRTFLFIAALLEDEATRVQWILLASDLRQRVLAAGRRLGVDDALLARVEEATTPRDGSESHRSHLHVRISCPPDDLPHCRERVAPSSRRGASPRRTGRTNQQRARPTPRARRN
jgi:penicillin-insensitive murein endopeptidase